MGDQRRSPPKTSLLFTALRSGGSLEFFCPELDYSQRENEVGDAGVCILVHHAEWDGLDTTSCGEPA